MTKKWLTIFPIVFSVVLSSCSSGEINNEGESLDDNFIEEEGGVSPYAHILDLLIGPNDVEEILGLERLLERNPDIEVVQERRDPEPFEDCELPLQGSLRWTLDETPIYLREVSTYNESADSIAGVLTFVLLLEDQSLSPLRLGSQGVSDCGVEASETVTEGSSEESPAIRFSLGGQAIEEDQNRVATLTVKQHENILAGIVVNRNSESEDVVNYSQTEEEFEIYNLFFQEFNSTLEAIST